MAPATTASRPGRTAGKGPAQRVAPTPRPRPRRRRRARRRRPRPPRATGRRPPPARPPPPRPAAGSAPPVGRHRLGRHDRLGLRERGRRHDRLGFDERLPFHHRLGRRRLGAPVASVAVATTGATQPTAVAACGGRTRTLTRTVFNSPEACRGRTRWPGSGPAAAAGAAPRRSRRPPRRPSRRSIRPSTPACHRPG